MSKAKTRAYYTRNVPNDLIDRLRVLAALRRTTIESEFVATLTAGLAAREPAILDAHRDRLRGSA